VIFALVWLIADLAKEKKWESAGFVAGAIARDCALRVLQTQVIIGATAHAFRPHACSDEPERLIQKTASSCCQRGDVLGAEQHFEAALIYAPVFRRRITTLR